ncbi:MAG: anti-repressor SinI family protein [Bacillus sp. (in: Bacteria)]|nr:anti-repressor SinI family protein [Bacillus sp. (in: firmicutes)]
MLVTRSSTQVIDHEWFALILEAKKLGLSLDAVREFLNQNEDKELLTKNS